VDMNGKSRSLSDDQYARQHGGALVTRLIGKSIEGPRA
jgi:hypothetical protein